MATQGTYYLDAPSLSSATIIYSDAELTVIAPDGFYSDGFISREQTLGVLLPQVTCPSCISYNCVEGTCIDPGDGTGTYPTLVDCEAICSPPLVTEVYFNTLIEDISTLGVNNYEGQTFDITFSYDIFALCDNEGTSGSDPNSAYSSLFVSSNGGSSYTTVATASAFVSGGSPTPQSDSQTVTGTYVVTGVTDVSLVKVYGTIDCNTGLNGQDGNVTAILSAITSSANIICNDRYIKACLGTSLTCTP